jgi:hypothetical protein
MKPETKQYIEDKIQELEGLRAEDKKLDMLLLEEISAREVNTKKHPELSDWPVNDMQREGKYIMKRLTTINKMISILKEILEIESSEG